jgi:hypothetical protein
VAEPKKPKKSARSSPDKKPLTADEAAALDGLLTTWEDDEYDNAGDFLSDVADYHDRALGKLEKRYLKAVDDAAQIMIDVYGE